MNNANEKASGKIRDISIQGCRLIGQGAHGKVYKLAPDMLVKVYNKDVDIDSIRKEQSFARKAFVKGIPTAIPFDIVRVGDQYGTVFELINAVSASEYIKDSDENLDLFIKKSVDLMRQIHSIPTLPGELPDMKKKTLFWAKYLESCLSPTCYADLTSLIESIPERHTILHADYHLKNILISKDDLILIDMDTLCSGDPIFELATIYNSYKEFPSIASEAAHFLGIDVQTAAYICDKTFEYYLEGCSEESIEQTILKAQIFGCVRIIDFMQRHDHPVKKLCIDKCLKDIERGIDQIY